MKPPSKKKSGWKYQSDFAEFHARHDRRWYTPKFNATIEGDIKDKSFSKEYRILEYVRMKAWGQMSDFAVDAMPAKGPNDPKPRPLTQNAIGEALELSKSAMSQGIARLKESGKLRKDHPFFYPEVEVSPLDLVGVNSDSLNSRSPFLRFQQYYYEKTGVKERLTEMQDERKRVQERNQELSREIRALERAAGSSWTKLDAETKALFEKEETETIPQRLCACAQYEGEHEANCKFSHTSEVNPDSHVKIAQESEPINSGVRTRGAAKTKETQAPAPAPLDYKELKARKRGVSVGQSVPGPTDRPTPRQLGIMQAIPAFVLTKTADSPSPALLDRIDAALGETPLELFAARVWTRQKSITSLGILEHLATDARKAWEATPKPMGTAGYPGMLISGRIPYETWEEMTINEQEQWKHLAPPKREIA